jgi:hypothetical protein
MWKRMLTALLERADFTEDALALVAIVVGALSFMCLVVVSRAAHADQPLPRGLFVLTGAGLQILLVLVLAVLALQAIIEILPATITP